MMKLKYIITAFMLIVVGGTFTVLISIGVFETFNKIVSLLK